MFKNIDDFYPTPDNLIDKMLRDVDFKYINNILEPSAGSGSILNYITEKLNHYPYNNKVMDIDCIEIDNNLQSILKGKGYRVVHDNFLTFNTYKHYSLIVANFPFSEGDKHLLKAIELCQNSHNSKIVCLLNAETIKNPFSNNRKILINKLEELNASIEFIPDAFITAERKTGVEIALIKINITKETKLNDSFIYNQLKQEENLHNSNQYQHNSSDIINGDFLSGLVEQCDFEIKAGLRLISEYNSLSKLILTSFKKDNPYNSSILELKLHYNDNNSNLENGYIKQVRAKYWEALFKSDQFIGACTNNLRQKYFDKINELKNYDFSLFNIYTIKIELNKEMIKGVEETILALFDELSYQHSYDNEFSKNIHYFNGWVTNKSWIINNRVITRLNCYNWYNKNEVDFDYKAKEKLSDIEKCLNYLSNGLAPEIDLNTVLENANKNQVSKKIETKYFYIDCYKKGTIHLTFKDMELLSKFNIFGSQRKGWLPPSYGKKSYKDMTTEEKHVVNNFHQGKGEKSYRKIFENKNYYITESSNLLMLT